MPTSATDAPIRLAELLSALSLAGDLALGQPAAHGLRATVLATRLAHLLRLSPDQQHSVYYTVLLRWLGCTSHAHEMAMVFGDEIAMRSASAKLELGDPAQLLPELLRRAGSGRPPLERLRLLAAVLAAGPKTAQVNFRTSCEVAGMLARRLECDDLTVAALGQTFERWDGRGFPAGLRGEAVALPARITALAYDAEVFLRTEGAEAAAAMVAKRAGHAYDPDVAAVFTAGAAALMEGLEEEPGVDVLVALEPEPVRRITGSEVDTVLTVIADFADLKSAYTPGHSRAVAVLADAAAQHAGLPEAEVQTVRRAALVHDLGRAGVATSIWDKAGPLTAAEWERVRLHPYLTERVLAQVPALAPLAEVAGLHHERLDGTGYHRGAKGPQQSLPAQLLAAADHYQAMTEQRPHRPAHSADDARRELEAAVRRGSLGPAAVTAVLQAAGHRVGARRALPAGLSAREVEVLRLAARGQSNRGIATALTISERTAGHHLQHAYEKIGVSTRGAASLFIIEQGLL